MANSAEMVSTCQTTFDEKHKIREIYRPFPYSVYVVVPFVDVYGRATSIKRGTLASPKASSYLKRYYPVVKLAFSIIYYTIMGIGDKRSEGGIGIGGADR